MRLERVTSVNTLHTNIHHLPPQHTSHSLGPVKWRSPWAGTLTWGIPHHLWCYFDLCYSVKPDGGQTSIRAIQGIFTNARQHVGRCDLRPPAVPALPFMSATSNSALRRHCVRVQHLPSVTVVPPYPTLHVSHWLNAVAPVNVSPHIRF